MAETAKNVVRSVLGQGLAMGWGDEAEAWLRSKLGDEEYENALREIQTEYGEFSQESPWISGLGEFAGGAAPAVATMLIPGTQAASIGPLSRLYGLGKTVAQRALPQNIARVATSGAVQGAVSGAGSADEGARGEGAVFGGLLGGTLGVAAPTIIRGGRQLFGSISDLAGVSTDKARQWALDKLNMSLDESSPKDIATRIRKDIQLGIPPSVANVTPGTVQLAESVVQRGGKPARELEKAIKLQQQGARDRVAGQVRRGLQAKDFYKEEGRLVDDLRSDANTMYDAAYAVGDISDPVVDRVLQEPEFQKFFTKAQNILDKKRLAAELDPQGDPSKYVLKPIYDPQTGQMVATPDVRTLDYIKQGIDAEINELFSAGKSAEARALKDLRSQFVNRIDALVPEYKAARAEYAGDMEVLDALRLGRDEFNKLDPEQVQNLMANMSKGELNAFRTGVARNLYDQIMDPRQNIDAARRLIGSPQTRKAIESTFETPAQRDFFLAALEREAELFSAATQILKGSPTAKRTAMKEALETRPGIAEAATETVSRGFTGSIVQGVLSLLRKGVPDEYYAELADLLKTGRPKDVATVVRLLEDAAKAKAPREAKIGATEAGITGGILGVAPPAPLTEEERRRAEERELLYQ